MKRTHLLGTLALSLGLLVATDDRASAHDDKYENLKVLADNGKALQKGMKEFSKGLGVKCTACHVKGDFDSDKVETKGKTRGFFEKVVGEKDKAKRDAALEELLAILKLDAAKAPDKVWAGVDKLQKKK